MSRLRRSRDESLYVLPGEQIPNIPKGYELDPNDKHRLRLIILDCKYRELIEPKKNCCGRSIHFKCKIINRLVTRLICHNCESNEQWIKNRGL